jgi:hypothetical protein
VGSRGPVPQRSDTLLGHVSKEQKDAITTAPGADVVEIPTGDPQWHPIARDWYASLAKSGQSRFYESSDWATARFLAEAMSRNLQGGRFSAQLFASVMAGMSTLLVTEGDRRRVRLELQRPTPGDENEKSPAEKAREHRLRLATG